jgi:hypothetical protein
MVVAEIAEGEPVNAGLHSRPRLPILQGFEPFRKRPLLYVKYI